MKPSSLQKSLPDQQLTDGEIALAARHGKGKSVEVRERWDLASAEVGEKFSKALQTYGEHEADGLGLGEAAGLDAADKVVTKVLNENPENRKDPRPLAEKWFWDASGVEENRASPLLAYLKRTIKNDLFDLRKRRNQEQLESDLPTDPNAEHTDSKLERAAEKAHKSSARRSLKLDVLRISIKRPDAYRLLAQHYADAVRETADKKPRAVVCYWLFTECGVQQKSLCDFVLVRGNPAREDNVSQWRSLAEKTILANFKAKTQSKFAWLYALAKSEKDLKEIMESVIFMIRDGYPESCWGQGPGDSAPKDGKITASSALDNFVKGRLSQSKQNEFFDRLARSRNLVVALADKLPKSGRGSAQSFSVPQAFKKADGVLDGAYGRLFSRSVRRLAATPKTSLAQWLTSAQARFFEAIIRQSGADSGTLWLEGYEPGMLQAAFSPLEPELVKMKASPPRGEGFISWVFSDGNSYSVNNDTKWVPVMSEPGPSDRYNEKVDTATGRKVTSMLAAKVRLFEGHKERTSTGHVVGVVTLVRFEKPSPEPVPFAKTDLPFVVLLSHGLAGAIERQLLASELRDPQFTELRAELKRVLPVAIEDNHAMAIGALLKDECLPGGFLDQLCLSLDGDSTSFWLKHHENDHLLVVGNPREVGTSRKPGFCGFAQRSTTGLVNWVWKTNKPVLMKCAPDAPGQGTWSADADHRTGKTTRQMIAVPVHSFSGKLKGVLTVVRFSDQNRRDWSESAVTLLESAAEALAQKLEMAIERAVMDVVG